MFKKIIIIPSIPVQIQTNPMKITNLQNNDFAYFFELCDSYQIGFLYLVNCSSQLEIFQHCQYYSVEETT